MSGVRRLRAPIADESVLAEPPLANVDRWLDTNRQRLAAGGQALNDMQTLARREAIDLAVDYLWQHGEAIPNLDHSRLLVAGHQPELSHPGVWVKHFALQGLARRHGLLPLHLIVDHDTVKSTSVRVPVRKDGQVALLSVPFDTWAGESPYEERLVQDETLFASFPERVSALLADWHLAPLLPDYWRMIRQGSSNWQPGETPSATLGNRLARGRRAFERRWGCHNLEVPTSWLCRTQTFAWFAAHLLLNSHRFLATHNAALAEYRRSNRIRSHSHPVPELLRDGEWCETPFWGWRVGQPQRGRLRVQLLAERLELRAGRETWPALPSSPDALVAAWPKLEQQGYKVRFRALTTTIFARLFLGELFIHGIGGGKYDELTNVIIRRFYGIEPPEYLILSATMHLPLPVQAVGPSDRRDLLQQLRHLHYNPDRHLSNGTAGTLIQQKRELIHQQPTDASSRRRRFQAIRAVSEQLRPLVADEIAATRQHLARIEATLEANAILERRDYAACLYPEAKLQPFLRRFLDG